jgi:RNA polymerase sigma-70 factor (ECF subfamily)
MSFDDVYRKYYKELRRFGRQLNISAEKCEDLTQETFMKFYVGINKGVIFNNPRAWLYKVYLNQFKTICNSREYDSGSEANSMKADNHSEDALEEYSKKEKRRIVFEMLDRLTDKEKAILILYNHGLSYAEMAEVLEINPNSVGTTLVRAIERLKETLKIHYNEMFEQN